MVIIFLTCCAYYLRLFGTLLVLSFCDFNFVMRHFLFLKTVSGKGFFNLFLASMFLVGNDGSIWGWIMMIAFCTVGIFFVVMGCCCFHKYDNTDIKQKDMKDKAKGAMNSKTNDGASDPMLDNA